MKRGVADSISDFVAASKPKVDEKTGEKITTEKYAAKIEVDTDPSIIHYKPRTCVPPLLKSYLVAIQ